MGLAPAQNATTWIGSGQSTPCGRMSAIASRHRPAIAISTSKLLGNNRRLLTTNASSTRVLPTNARRLPARRLHVVNAFLTKRPLVALWPNALLSHNGWRPPKSSSCGFAAAASTFGFPPDFAATTTQGGSCMFAIQAGLLLAHGACGGAASTGSCSARKGFGR
jgi:hypothetical protein